MSGSTQEKNYAYFKSVEGELREKFGSRYVVIHDCSVAGDFETFDEAYERAICEYGLGNFIIQGCSPDDAMYNNVFHSRVTLVS